MINHYTLNQPDLVLKSDLAGEFPLYLYWPQDQSILLNSKSITALLDDARVPKPLKISDVGISFLLQSGVVPPPKTAYQDIYIVGIGDKAEVSTRNGKIEVTFSHQFPFMNANRLQPDEMQPDEDLILQMLAEATISQIDESKPSFLFHSAGKDSNSIALAFAEAGWQDKVTLITHKSKSQKDESEISAKIAKQLGFKHRILHEVDQLQTEHKQGIDDYYTNAPFPCTDNVSLAYPLYAIQLPELKGANIIDGGGNDSYMMVPPTRREQNILPFSRMTSRFSFIRHWVESEGILNSLLKTTAERCGMSGLSFQDSKYVYGASQSVYSYWRYESLIRREWDLIDFKTDILTTIIAAEVHIRKARNFTDSTKAKLILPFANKTVAEYFATMPEAYLFNRKKLKNKLILRKLLKDRIDLDSDLIGKMGFSYDKSSVLHQNWTWVNNEIVNCPFWKRQEVQLISTKLKKLSEGTDRKSQVAAGLLNRLLLLSLWQNKNKYLFNNKGT